MEADRAAATSDDVADEREWQTFAKAVGVPPRLRAASFRAAQPSTAVEAARAYAEGPALVGASLVLAGPTGVGKTYAAVAALRAVSRTDTNPEARAFVYFPSACAALLDGERRPTMLERLTETPFVVVDDFGVEYVKEGGLLDALTDEIIWHREAYGLPTLITTNLTRAQLHERCSDRIVDRLSAWGKIAECRDKNFRSDGPPWVGPSLSLSGYAPGQQPRDTLRDEWFNACKQGELGECVKTEFLTHAPEWARRQCPEHAAR